MDEAEPHLIHFNVAEARNAFAQKLRELARCLDAGKPAARNHEGEQRFLLRRFAFDVRKLQAAEYVITQAERVVEVLERQRMLVHACHRREIADLAERENEMVIGHLDQRAALALHHLHNLVRGIDPDDAAPAELDCAQQVADRIDDVVRIDAARRDLGQQRLEDEIILFRQQLDMHVVAPLQ
jgi:hypothetical protein